MKQNNTGMNCNTTNLNKKFLKSKENLLFKIMQFGLY